MRKIKSLTNEQVDLLRKAIRENSSNAFRKRCQCILYSFHGLTVTELMEVFEVDRRSIYNWLNRWEKGGLDALSDRPGRGLKPKLNPANDYHVQEVLKAMQVYARQPQQVLNHVNTHLPVSVSQDTLRRFVKKLSTTVQAGI
ncbi:helix-turn-helix domain-containing protein [Tellurirhabdus rosea]|uniref:helix-turn-helix domain-containing protein n=1 Tax=Tellurirhabdus rosea TaxID=2674997 RepID=UPI00224F073C|nr:helix-turn-helix domain-containing protein [Tellurirhabdus rosea]